MIALVDFCLHFLNQSVDLMYSCTPYVECIAAARMLPLRPLRPAATAFSAAIVVIAASFAAAADVLPEFENAISGWFGRKNRNVKVKIRFDNNLTKGI